MITGAGAGASICTVTPARLRPKTPKLPRGSSQPQQLPPLPAQSQPPPVQEISVPAPPQFLHNYLLHKTNIHTGSAFGGSSVLDPDYWDLIAGDNRADGSTNSFFRGSQSPTSSEFLEPPSPKSFYSVATSSSGGTARGISTVSLEEFTQLPPLPPMDHLLQQQQSRKLERTWSNSPEAAQTQLGTSPETPGFYGADLDQSNWRNSRKKSSSRDPSVRTYQSIGSGREIWHLIRGAITDFV